MKLLKDVHFYPERAIGKYHAVTNHDNSYKYFAFPLIGCTNIEIDGGGSDFIFHGVMTPFLVENSMGIKLKNFSIDWKEPFYLQAEVLESNALEQYHKPRADIIARTDKVDINGVGRHRLIKFKHIECLMIASNMIKFLTL